MATQSLLNDVKQLLVSKDGEGNYPFYVRYAKEIGLVFLVSASIVGVYFGYTWYNTNREQAAHYAFGTLLDRFNTIRIEKVPVGVLAQQFADGYQKHSATRMAPYFLVAQADVLVYEGKKDEALKAMDLLLASISEKTPFIALFKSKRALLALDSGKQDRIEQSLKELEDLAYDEKNMHQDYALYNLGQFYWVHNDVEKARIAWKRLVDMQDGGTLSASPWVSLVSDKLASVA